MKHSNIYEFMDWLSEQCKKDFDNDKDLIDAGIVVSEDIDLNNKVFKSINLANESKEEQMKIIIDMLEANIQLLQLAPHLVFSCASLSCAFCWVRDT